VKLRQINFSNTLAHFALFMLATLSTFLSRNIGLKFTRCFPPSRLFRSPFDRITPTIARVVTVPLYIELVGLHDVIQCLRGWQDSHLHLFTIHGKEYVDHRTFDLPEAEDELLMTLAEA